MHGRPGRWSMVLVLAVVTACAGSSSGVATPAPPGLERKLAARVDAHRRESGLPPLVYSEVIAAVARRHSQRMAGGDTRFGHDGMQRRADELSGRMPLVGMAENVSRHQRTTGLADAALAGWLGSQVHRTNLEGDYQLTGVGGATSPDGVVYVTQIFVRTRR